MKFYYYVAYNRSLGFGYPLRTIFQSSCPPDKAMELFHSLCKTFDGDEIECFATIGQCRLFAKKLAIETDTELSTRLSEFLEKKVKCYEN